MRVFVTGATGFIGQALTRELIAHGHEVIGLARSGAAATTLRAMGVGVVRGSVRDVDGLRRAAAHADGVVHLAFTFSPLDMAPRRLARVFLGGSPFRLVQRMMAAIGATDRAAIDALGSALQGSGRPLVTTFATMGLAGLPGEMALKAATEEDPPNPRSAGYARAVNEEAVAHWTERDVRASLVRLPPSVHGEGDKGLIPQLINAARKAGEALYVDEGAQRWFGVHRDDACALFRLALEQGAPGGIYHAVGDDGARFKDIAEAIGGGLNLPVRRNSLAEARRALGLVAPFVATDNPVSSALTQQRIGWKPQGPTLMQELDHADYFNKGL